MDSEPMKLAPRTEAEQRALVTKLRGQLAADEIGGLSIRVTSRAERDALAAQLTPLERPHVTFTFETPWPDLRDGDFTATTLDRWPAQ